ncbi:prepilin-type N-terminal cleavage/methylation domain-containing protein [Geminisphaera colitermitum]|uniref:prepilin-type N-terminal cleavage/methylation domain-containing protein n=1 Tax=Geminisphaera colitermitum TaxID=1148786 RepID=UPI000158CCAF|nr:prepilin-type N-terminal cleavage/methylation domain-containing protein [Geminisphaera colitermitum]
MSSPKRTTAFTLVELLTVIAIIGILAAILIPTVAAVRDTANSAKCTANLRQIGTALQLFAADHRDMYPRAYYNYGPGPGKTVSEAIAGGDWGYRDPGSGWDSILLRDYMSRSSPVFLCPSDKTGIMRSVSEGSITLPIAASYRFNQTHNRVNGAVWAGRAIRVSELPLPSRAIAIVEATGGNHHVGMGNDTSVGFIKDDTPGPVAHDRHKGAANYLFFDGHVEKMKWADTWAPLPLEGSGRTRWYQIGN